MALDESKENDVVVEEKGFSFLIDGKLAKQYKHFSIVYQKGFIFKGLRVFAQGASYC